MILVTGGCGYIGSHTVVSLLNENKDVVIVDDLSNSKIDVIDKIESITSKKVKFYQGDVSSNSLMEKVFSENIIDAVIHFAGFKAVGESCKKPLMYYRNNIDTTLTLLEVMQKHDCFNFIFSSSATVYGKPQELPIKEDFPLSVTNPYGRTKLMIEDILRDLVKADDRFNVMILRYFNPIGAHESGLLGESPNGIPNNLMPYILKVAMGSLPYVHVFGDDYDTPDGTGVRDYIHVVDLANFHVKACNYLDNHKGCFTFNLGTGKGSSVLEIINTFEKVSGKKIEYKIESRRPGDIDSCYADTSLAEKELGYKATHTLDDACLSGFKFATMDEEGK